MGGHAHIFRTHVQVEQAGPIALQCLHALLVIPTSQTGLVEVHVGYKGVPAPARRKGCGVSGRLRNDLLKGRAKNRPAADCQARATLAVKRDLHAERRTPGIAERHEPVDASRIRNHFVVLGGSFGQQIVWQGACCAANAARVIDVQNPVLLRQARQHRAMVLNHPRTGDFTQQIVHALRPGIADP